MATTYKHSFTHADGRIDTRDSVSRIYTHVVVVTHGTADQIRAALGPLPDWYTDQQRADRDQQIEAQGGQQVVLSWSASLKNATNAARAVKLTGYWVKAEVATCQMTEHSSKSAPMKEFTVTDATTGKSVVVEAINEKRARWEGWKALKPVAITDLAAVMTKTAKQLAAVKTGA